MRESIPYKISKTHINLQDKDIHLDSFTELNEDQIFLIEPKPKRSFEKSQHVQVDITIEMNRD